MKEEQFVYQSLLRLLLIIGLVFLNSEVTGVNIPTQQNICGRLIKTYNLKKHTLLWVELGGQEERGRPTEGVEVEVTKQAKKEGRGNSGAAVLSWEWMCGWEETLALMTP